MKNKMYLFIPLFSAILISIKAQAKYHIVHSSAADSCDGLTFVTTSVDTGSSVLKLKTYYGDGTSDTNTLGLGFVTKWHWYNTPGTYTIKVVLCDATYTIRYDSLSYSYTPGTCHLLYGKVYRDMNSNCTYDAADDLLHTSYTIEVDSAGTAIDTIIGYGGQYQYTAHSIGSTFTFKLIDFPSYLTNCVTSLTAISLASPVHVGDFGLQCTTTGSYDVSIAGAWAYAAGHDYAAGASIFNYSCNAKNGAFSINIDPRYNNISWIYPPTGAISGSTITWSYTGLDVDHPQWFMVIAYTDSLSPLTIGSTVTTAMDIIPVSGDADTTNNHWTSLDTIKSSWDPNEKDVSPRGNILAGTTLTYTIRFENTGNAPATNIHILDTLAPTVDPGTIQLLTSTHPLNYSSRVAGGKTILKFDFPGINLLDSSHHGQADGMVMYSIKTKTGLANGTKIDNRAGIYFDANPVVMTNVAENIIGPLAVPILSAKQVSVYPNPVHNEFVIKTNTAQYYSATIINTMGQIILQQSLQPGETYINIHSLVPGMYYVMLKGNSGVKVEKIEKL